MTTMVGLWQDGLLSHSPKASCVEWLAALQTRLQILEIVRELLILSKFHHIIEVLHVLDHCVQLKGEEGGQAHLSIHPQIS